MGRDRREAGGMSDPFAAGHRHKAREEVKAAEKAETAATEARVKAKYDAAMKPKPAAEVKPYVPPKAPWDQ